MHFAALLSVGDSVAAPARYYQNNVLRDAGAARCAGPRVGRAAGVLVDRGGLRRAAPDADCRGPSPRGRSTRTARPSWPSSGRCRTTSGRTACAPCACGTSTRPAPIRTGRSARTTAPRSISFRARWRRRRTGRRWSSSATTTPPRTAPAAGTTCTSPTWRPRTSSRSPRSRRASRPASTTSGTAARSRCATSSRPSSASRAGACATRWGRGAAATRRCCWPRASARGRSSAGSPIYEELDVIVETAWRWHRSHPRGYAS